MKFKAIKSLLIGCVFAVTTLSAAESIESLMATGQALLQRGAYNQAVTAFKQVLSQEADNFEAQFNLGFAYLQWGRNNNAVEEFKKALKWQPKNSEIWANLAIAYENLSKKEEALYALNQAVILDPQNITARMNLAVMYVNADRPKQALEQYRKVLEIDGSNEEALVNISKCLIEQGSYDDAAKYLKQITVSNPNNSEAHYELGNIYWKRQNDINHALSEYKLAVTLTPTNPVFYDNYAAAQLEKGNKEDAIELLKKQLLYTDDILKKDKIQAQINRLETGSSAGAKNTDTTTQKLTTKDQISDLKKELGRENPSETKRIETKPVNVLGDLQDLSVDTTQSIDLKSEAKKRAAQ